MATTRQVTDEAVFVARTRDEASATNDKIAGSFNRMAGAADGAGAAVEETAQRVTRAGPSFDAVNRRLDEGAKLTAALERAHRRHQQALDTLDRERQAGNLTAEREAELARRSAALRDADIARARRQAEAHRQALGIQDQATAAADRRRWHGCGRRNRLLPVWMRSWRRRSSG